MVKGNPKIDIFFLVLVCILTNEICHVNAPKWLMAREIVGTLQAECMPRGCKKAVAAVVWPSLWVIRYMKCQPRKNLPELGKKDIW